MPFSTERMSLRRKEKKLTQEQLAQQLGDLPKQRVSEWETGKYSPMLDTVEAIADALECSIDWLMGRSNTPAINAAEKENTK